MFLFRPSFRAAHNAAISAHDTAVRSKSRDRISGDKLTVTATAALHLPSPHICYARLTDMVSTSTHFWKGITRKGGSFVHFKLDL